MIKTIALEDMYAMESQHDPSIVFHGTSSCFVPGIESNGWPVNSRPYNWDDIQFVIELCERLKVGAEAFLFVNHDLQRKRYPHGSGAYFTYMLQGAVQYAGATGGETVRCALRSANHLLVAIADKSEFKSERTRLLRMTAVWNAWLRESVPVVYAVKITDELFPDSKFGGLVTKSTSSFAYQLREQGEIWQKNGDFWATKSIPPSTILAKVILPPSYIEDLRLDC